MLFNKKRSVRALGDEAINTIKQELQSMLDVAASFDEAMAKTGNLTISLEGRVRGDLLAFLLYLSGAGRSTVDPREILIVNKIFDIDLSHVDFELFRKDVGDKSFESAVPPSVLIFNEMGGIVQREQFKTNEGNVAPQGQTDELSQLFVSGLINLYALIGSAFLTADGVITKRESSDLIRYLCMLNRATTTHDLPLPEGAARQAYDAHIRLFGKAPKL